MGTIRADNITDEAGTGAPNCATGLQVNGTLVLRNLQQTKTLTAGASPITSTNADIADLKINNLTVGKLYRVTLCNSNNLTTAGNPEGVDLTFTHNSVQLLSVECRMDSYSGGDIRAVSLQRSAYFVAAATTGIVGVTITGGGQLIGDTTTKKTYITIEEMNTTDVSTAF
jgi:hypothetical protein